MGRPSFRGEFIGAGGLSGGVGKKIPGLPGVAHDLCPQRLQGAKFFFRAQIVVKLYPQRSTVQIALKVQQKHMKSTMAAETKAMEKLAQKLK